MKHCKTWLVLRCFEGKLVQLSRNRLRLCRWMVRWWLFGRLDAKMCRLWPGMVKCVYSTDQYCTQLWSLPIAWKLKVFLKAEVTDWVATLPLVTAKWGRNHAQNSLHICHIWVIHIHPGRSDWQPQSITAITTWSAPPSLPGWPIIPIAPGPAGPAQPLVAGTSGCGVHDPTCG
jgi:hypothetical protein